MKELTEKQQAIYNFIQDNLRLVPPTYREIAKKFGCNLPAARDFVKAIEKKGWLPKREKYQRYYASGE